MKHLKLQVFRSTYKEYKTGIPVLDFLFLGLLVWIEEAYIDYKVEKEVDEAIDRYLEWVYDDDQPWHETASIKEEWNDTGIPLPTLSISHPAVEKDETPERSQD